MTKEKKEKVCKVFDSGRVTDEEGNPVSIDECDVALTRKGTKKVKEGKVEE